MLAKTCDWVDCSLFLMIAIAETTDHYLDEQEIEAISTKIKQLVATVSRANVPVSNPDINQKFNAVFEWYTAIGEEAPQDKMDVAIQKEIGIAANYLKDQDWFTPTFAQAFITDLIAIAHADGEVIKNEVRSIYTIAQLWNVENPFNE